MRWPTRLVIRRWIGARTSTRAWAVRGGSPRRRWLVELATPPREPLPIGMDRARHRGRGCEALSRREERRDLGLGVRPALSSVRLLGQSPFGDSPSYAPWLRQPCARLLDERQVPLALVLRQCLLKRGRCFVGPAG